MKRWTPEETEPFSTPWREAELLYFYDADTPKLRTDLGFAVDGVKTYVRLLSEGVVLTPDDKTDDGFDAWEVRGDERLLGLEATARARELIPDGSTVRIWSFKGRGSTGKYGRWLCVLLYQDGDAWLSLADVLLAEGHGTR